MQSGGSATTAASSETPVQWGEVMSRREGAGVQTVRGRVWGGEDGGTRERGVGRTSDKEGAAECLGVLPPSPRVT